MNTVTVRISGVEYNLKGEEPEEYLHRVAMLVDRKMQEIIGNNNMLSSSSACVLTAINAIDEMFKAQSIKSELTLRVKQFEESNKALQTEIESLRREIEEASRTNMELQRKIESSEGSQRQSMEENEAKIHKEMDILQQTAEKYIAECTKLRVENKEMKFQLQSAKYKVIDLQQKLLDNQIDLATFKKHKNAVVNK